jgi:hypothetical protein
MSERVVPFIVCVLVFGRVSDPTVHFVLCATGEVGFAALNRSL